MRWSSRRLRLLVLVAAVVPTIAASGGRPVGPPERQPTSELVGADDFTGTAAPWRRGRSRSSRCRRAATVTGCDALIGIRGVAEDDTLTVTVNGRDVTGAFETAPDPYRASTLHAVGLVDGLLLGDNSITASVDGPTTGCGRRPCRELDPNFAEFIASLHAHDARFLVVGG